ncbi:MAG: bifunctional serine/threonine-protein kinase/formylglycine-generating enzyme family protein [bacterium]
MSASGPPDGDHATLPPHARSTLAARPDAAAGTMTRSLGGDEDAQPPAAAHVDFGTDRYEDLGLIGRGGQGEVRRVRDHKMNRVLALKLLRTAASTAARQRFLVETAITVGLQHPGIVPVYDRGVTPDGRPWYTMKEVEGRDFGDAIAEAHAGGDDAWTLRQLVDTFLRVCEAVAYAHEQGVVHRDLKPQNVMIGRFGEVLVMDWGLARRAGAPADPDDGVSPPTPQATALGAVMGTPAYMAPEQASGDTAAIGPATDVYALGVMLHEVLTGRRPATGGFERIRAARLAADGPVPAVGPAPLRALCARATRRDPAERPPDAGAMAREVGRWLAGARQREQARALVAQAQAIEPEVDTLRAEAARLEREAAALLDALPPHAPVDDKRPGWLLADAARAQRRAARLAEVRLRLTLQSALELDPESSAARQALTGHYRARLLEAEAARDLDAAAEYAALLEGHDPAGNVEWLAGEGRLTLLTDPPGARVELFRFVEADRRLVEVPVASPGATPVNAAPLAMGSYVAVISAPGRAPVRYPVSIERQAHWDGIAPGEREPHVITLPPRDAIGDGECHVPAGWCTLGGDPEALDPLPRRRVWVDGFVIGRDPVTHAEYIEFLDALVAAGRTDEALAAVPVASATQELGYRRDARGRFVVHPAFGHDLRADWPVMNVSWRSARAWCAWRAARDGLDWRLPMSWEWEKAARGVDGRPFPWGDDFDVSYACVLNHRPGQPTFAPVGAHPLDASPYGVRGLAGNTRDLCADVYRPSGPILDGGRLGASDAPGAGDFVTIKGGCCISLASSARASSRYGMPPGQTLTMVGFRPCRSVTSWDRPPSRR